jgi:hypothetical protein
VLGYVLAHRMPFDMVVAVSEVEKSLHSVMLHQRCFPNGHISHFEWMIHMYWVFRRAILADGSNLGNLDKNNYVKLHGAQSRRTHWLCR